MTIEQLVKEKLTESTVIKNYKKMCELLGEEIKTGESKKSQEKKWKRYFDYEKEKQKYIIVKIYDEPLPPTDGRVLGNNNEYVEHIKFILLNYLSKQEGYTAKITLKKLFLLLGMINHNYMKADNSELIVNNDCITEYQINHFYQRTYQKLRETIFSSLKNLKNRCLILYEEITMININIKINEYEIKNIDREATDKEKELILKVHKEVLEDMGLESMILVHLKFKQNEFYNRVNSLIRERYNINYSYTDIKIIYNYENIVEAKEQAELQMQKRMLNDKFINSVNKQAERILDKNKQKYEEEVMSDIYGEPNPSKVRKFFKLDDEVYLYAQKKLAELLMRY